MVAQCSYKIAYKRKVIAVAVCDGVRPASRVFDIQRTTVHDWVRDKKKITEFAGSVT